MLTIGILWRGRPEDAASARETTRLRAIFDAIEAQGAGTEALVFAEEVADRIRERIAALDAVLTWVDPIVAGRDRSALDALLRHAAGAGVYVSAHPDVILKMGTKDVLVCTREMAWGTDSHRVDSPAALRERLPPRLRTGARVLKQHRGSSGDGVWKVELVRDAPAADDMLVEVRHAVRGSRAERLALGSFIARCAPYFATFGGSGCLIDQPYQARASEGMVRAYLSGDRVVGFGHQFVTALLPLPAGVEETPAPPPRYYFGPEKPEFQALRTKLESGWVAELQQRCGVATDELPAIWDADFLLGPTTAAGEDSYVLCEINVSGVFPIPDAAVPPLAAAAIRGALRGRPLRA
jgi:hypothetical protein